MTDMFRGRGAVRRGNEKESKLDEFVRKLEAAGVPENEIVRVLATWDYFDAEWTPERRAEVQTWSPDRLRRDFIAIATEEIEGRYEAPAEPLSDLRALAAKVVEGTIPEVLAWVGDLPVRAQVAWDAEQDGKGRERLLRQLQAKLEG